MFEGRFIKDNNLIDEAKDSETINWLYKYEDESIIHIKLPTKYYGKGYSIMQQMVYKGNVPIGQIKEGIAKPIQPTITRPKEKIGLGYSGDTKEATLQKYHEETIFKKSHKESTL
jgi:hypothetical protein